MSFSLRRPKGAYIHSPARELLVMVCQCGGAPTYVIKRLVTQPEWCCVFCHHPFFTDEHFAAIRCALRLTGAQAVVEMFECSEVAPIIKAQAKLIAGLRKQPAATLPRTAFYVNTDAVEGEEK